MRIITINVNGIRAAERKGFFSWLSRQRADVVCIQELKAQVRKVIDSLSRKEAEIIKKRFGIGDDVSHTLEEVGKHFKVTRDRIRQLEGKALRKLRHPQRSHTLKLFLEKSM